MDLEFHFDLACPQAWLAATAVEEVALRVGARLVWRPTLLDEVLRAVGGDQRPASAWSPARAAMDERDLLRQAALRGLPVTPRPPGSAAPAMRLLVAAPEPLRPALGHALLEAIHVQGIDPADPVALERIGAGFGLDPARARQAAAEEELRHHTQVALERGAFGVPSFWAATAEAPQGRLWWGADRLHLVEAALRGASCREEAPPDLQREGAADRPPGPAGRSELEVFHDFSSPFSYLGVTQAARIAARHEATLTWRPMLLGALFRAVGSPNVPIAEMNAARARYFLQDLQDWARWWGVPLRFPDCFPVRTVTALRVSLLEPRAIHALYRALWVEGRDIGQDEVVRGVLAAHGLDPALVEASAAPEVKERLRQNTERAELLGACGAPSFLVRTNNPGGRPIPDILIWGQDRFDLVGACLGGWRPPV
ncbi:DsbA family protein [Myxococcota bacterium]|nr:DsbA family protein [Myxococcota bacterium]